MMNTTLEQLQAPDEYRSSTPGRQRLFPSKGAFDWYYRTHRDDLVRCRAVLMICGRRMVNPELFDNFVVNAGANDLRAAAPLPSLEIGA